MNSKVTGEGTVVPFSPPYCERSTRPSKLFLLDQVVINFGVLEAAITADLYYWIARGERPWRVVSDYAHWFRVNEKTIRMKVKSLTNSQFFNVERTRMRSGSFGANRFSRSKSKNSTVLFDNYKALLNNKTNSEDFGQYSPDEPNYREIPRFQMLFINTVLEVGEIKAAYVLDRICWAMNARGCSVLYLNSEAHFSRWANLDRKTAMRKLDHLRKNGFLDYSNINGQLVISANWESDAFFRFSDFIEDKEECRKAGIMDGIA